MIASLLLTVVPPCAAVDTLDFGWRPGDRARVHVVERDSVYDITLRVEAAPESENLVVRRASFEATHVAGEPVDSERSSHLEWIALRRDVPDLVVDAQGAFVELTALESAWKRVRKSLSRTNRAARAMPLTPALRTLWLPHQLRQWGDLAEGWSDVPLEPGTHRRDGRIFVGKRAETPLPVTFEYEVREPELRDGRRLVEIRRKAQLRSEAGIASESIRGMTVADFLYNLEAAPSDSRYAESFRFVQLVRGWFDPEAGRPVEIESTSTTTIGMRSPRSTWSEEVEHLSLYSFEWDVADEDPEEAGSQ